LDDGRFVGIVTNYDILNKFINTQERIPAMTSSSYKATNVPLDNVVNRNPLTIEQSRGLSDAARMLLENKVSSIVVTKGDKPIGMITELDIIESVMAKSGSKGEKIFISGLDSETYQYEDELREELRTFIAKMEKLSSVNIDYITIVVKKFKTKSYEMSARVSLGNQGILNSHITGHIFERTLRDLLDILAHDLRKKKERSLTVRRVLFNAHQEEEVE
jgi:CBS domain-containing protein